MNKYFRMLCALVAAVVVHGASAKDIYGFMTGNADPSAMPIGMYKFDTDDGSTLELQQSLTFQLWGGAFAGGYYYMLLSDDASGYLPEGLCRYDIDSKTINMGYAYQEYECSDMTYDYSTNTMYGVMTKNGGQDVQHQLVTIDLQSGARTLVAKLSDKVTAIACDYFGDLYAMSASSKLYIMDKHDGSMTLVGNTHLAATTDQAQSMEFDRATGQLYWTGLDTSDNAFFCQLDATTGEVVKRTQLDNNALIGALHIPFQMAADDAPARVQGLQADVDGQSVALAWTNPTTNYAGAELATELTRIEIERDGHVVATIDSPAAGQAMQWTDALDDTTEGKLRYTIYACNDAGRGEPASIVVTVGEDAPGVVEHLCLKAEDNDACLTWDAPQTGKNGGTLKPENLRYDITRMPDGKSFADIVGTAFRDTTIATPAYYSYSVSCHNSQGESDAVITDTLALGGAATVPYEADLTQSLGAAQWRVVDANHDNVTWTYNREKAKYTCYTFYQNAANDSLLSVPFRLEKGTTYTAKYNINATSLYGTSEHFCLALLGGGTTRSLEDLSAFSTDGVQERSVDFNVADDGLYSFALVALSDPDQWCIEISGFAIVAPSSTDLAVDQLQSDDTLTEGVAATASVGVANKGTESVQQYTLTLIDQSGQTLATQSVQQCLEPGQRQVVQMEWTPSTDISSVTATVSAEGDMQQANNAITKSVVVMAPGEQCIVMGDGQSTPTIIPFGFEGYTYSYSQTIYRAEDTGGQAGKISELMYDYDNHGDEIADRHVVVYMSNSESASVTAGWNAAADMTLVYDGLVTLGSGTGKMRLRLDEPFNYDGGNLCIMCQKLDDATIGDVRFYALNCDGDVRSALYNADQPDVVLTDVQGSTMLARVAMRFKPTGSAGVGLLSDEGCQVRIGQGSISVEGAYGCTISVHDVSGRLVAKAASTNTLDITTLTKGVYVVSVVAKGATLCRKFAIH